MRFGERRNVKEIADLHWSSRQTQFHAPGPAELLKAEHSNEVAMIDKERESSEIEALLPWHAAGTLSRRDADLVERALAGDSELARRYDVVRRELAETIRLNETLGAPSARAMEKLFAAIDAEETAAPTAGVDASAERHRWQRPPPGAHDSDKPSGSERLKILRLAR